MIARNVEERRRRRRRRFKIKLHNLATTRRERGRKRREGKEVSNGGLSFYGKGKTTT